MIYPEINIDKYTKKYIESHSDKFSYEATITKARRKIVSDQINKIKPDNILEIGCGIAPLFTDLLTFNKYIIVEPSDEFVKMAKQISKKIEKVLIIRGYLEDVYTNLPKDLDFIVCSGVLHEVPNPKRFLEAIYKICNENTIVHINVPNANSFHRLLAYEMGLIRSVLEMSKTDIKFQRYSHFDKQSLFDIVKANDFEILSYGTYFVKPFNNEQMEKILINNIVDKSVINGLEGMIKYMPDLGCEIFINIRIKPKL